MELGLKGKVGVVTGSSKGIGRSIAEALARGEMVKVSSFGSFAVRKKGRRIGRNPKTGKEVPINPRRVLVFRASHVLKDQINNTLSKANTGTSVA